MQCQNMTGITVLLYGDTLKKYVEIAFFFIEARFLKFTAPVMYRDIAQD